MKDGATVTDAVEDAATGNRTGSASIEKRRKEKKRGEAATRVTATVAAGTDRRIGMQDRNGSAMEPAGAWRELMDALAADGWAGCRLTPSERCRARTLLDAIRPDAVTGKAEDGRAIETGPVRADGASEREIEAAIRRNLRRMADIGGSFVLMQERR